MKALASILLVLAFGLMSAQAQTLADAAREARESKSQGKKTSSSSNVYTDETIALTTSQNAVEGPSTKPSREEHREAKKTTSLQWKAAIATQKNVVTALQSQIEKVEKSIQFVTANGYSNGPQYNAVQKRKQDQVELAKQRLEQEKQKLETLKEAARKAGFGGSVYDQ